MVQSGAYICSTPEVEISVGLQKRLGAGIFGGAGVIFQRLSGDGTAWVQLAGEIVEYELAPGQSMLIHPGHLALFRRRDAAGVRLHQGHQEQVLRRLPAAGPDPGPGPHWLQSMTPAKLAAAIEPYLPDKSSGSSSDN